MERYTDTHTFRYIARVPVVRLGGLAPARPINACLGNALS